MIFANEFNGRLANKFLRGASLTALALTCAAPALAQGDSTAETVVVTGTLIKGINPVGTNLISFDADQIKSAGVQTTDQLLAQIPQITNAFNTNFVPSANGNQVAIKPQIRNIAGSGPTLVLVDGHNMAGDSVLSTTFDPGLLPSGVVQTVAVIPDGGSSLYGANAVTGVINFVTRTRFSGLQTDINYGLADGYTSHNINLMAGTDWGGGSVYLAGEIKGNSYLMNDARSYNAQNLVPIGGRDTRGTACALPNITVGANNYAQTSLVANTPGSLKASVTGPFQGLQSTTANNTNDNPTNPNLGQFNRCDTGDGASYVPREEAYALYGSFQQNLANGVDLSIKALWSSRVETALLTQVTATGTIDNTNPYFQSLAGETVQTIQFNFAPALGQTFTNSSTVQMFQVTPQLTVQLPFGDWEAKLMANYGRSLSAGSTRAVNTVALAAALRRTTVNGVQGPPLVADPVVGNAFDPYNVTLNNPTLMQSLTDWSSNTGHTNNRQEQFQGQLDGTVFHMPGGDVKAVIGGKYSWDGYGGLWVINGPFGQVSGANVTGGQFSVGKNHRVTTSGFGEVNVPIVGEDNSMILVKELQFDLSGRIDNYSDFGATDNFKVGFTYKPFDELSIRANTGTSFDAPQLSDTLALDGRINYTAQRTAANAIVPPGTSAADALRPSILVPGGNPNLKPETAHTWSVGADFTPGEIMGVDLTGLAASITGWHVGEAHQIALAPFSSVLLFQVPAYAPFFIINPTLAQVKAFNLPTVISGPGPTIDSAYPVSLGGTAPNGSINAPYILYDARRNNLTNAQLDGLDFSVNYTTDTNWGKLSGGFTGTTTLYNANAAPGGAFTSIQASGVGLYQVAFNLGWAQGPYVVRLTMNYSPSYLANPASQAVTLYGQTRIPAFHPINVFTSYDLNNLFSWTSGASVSLAIDNIGNDAPPIFLTGGATLPNGSSLGRYFQIGLHKTF